MAGSFLNEFMPWKNLIDGTVGKVLDAYLPKDMSEKERAEILLKARETAIKEAKQAHEDNKLSFDDRASARDLAKADVQSESILARNIRPMFLIVIVAIILNSQLIYPWFHDGKLLTLDPQFSGLFELVVMFYFGGRSIEKVSKIVTGNSASGSLSDAIKNAAKKIKNN